MRTEDMYYNEQNCVRYCDENYHQLWEKIDSDQYKNLVISSDDALNADALKRIGYSLSFR